MIQLFTGYDAREAIGWHAFAQSVIEHSSEPVNICALTDKVARDGSNAFTYSRFLVPYLCGFSGFAIFVDGADMIAHGDIAELAELASGWHAVQVVKHRYQTRNHRKYVGTEMECENTHYPRKNWSSVIIWNCAHYRNRVLTPDFIAKQTGAYLHGFQWLQDERIGELPIEWNWLCDEYGANTTAKILHWTAGIPMIAAYRDAPHAADWFRNSSRAIQAPRATAPLSVVKAAA